MTKTKTDERTDERVRELVREGYAKIAEAGSTAGACCGPQGGCGVRTDWRTGMPAPAVRRRVVGCTAGSPAAGAGPSTGSGIPTGSTGVGSSAGEALAAGPISETGTRSGRSAGSVGMRRGRCGAATGSDVWTERSPTGAAPPSGGAALAVAAVLLVAGDPVGGGDR